MKKTVLWLALLLTVSGCATTTERMVTTTKDTTQASDNGVFVNNTKTTTRTTRPNTPTAEDVQRDTSKAWSTTSQYAANERDRISAELETQWQRLQSQIDALRASQAHQTGGERVQTDQKIAGLQIKRQQVDQLKAQMAKAGAGTVQNLKLAWDKLKVQIDQKVRESKSNQDSKQQ